MVRDTSKRQKRLGYLCFLYTVLIPLTRLSKLLAKVNYNVKKLQQYQCFEIARTFNAIYE